MPIYLDNNATTPVDERVLEAMLPYFRDAFGNAASRSHAFGWRAESAVDAAREATAAAIGAEPKEIVFTSGATESNNLAIKGVAEMYADRGKHIVTATTEHNAVLDPCRTLERKGFRITRLPVDRRGFIDPDELRAAISDETILVSIMHGNNEIGTVQEIGAIGAICRERAVLFHTDATQTVGKIPFDVESLHVDLASFTAHKIYGPKGCGALYVRGRKPRVRLVPQIDGGGHERGFRSGTLNVPGIVGLGRALEIATAERVEADSHDRRLRDRLWRAIRENLPNVVLNGPDPIAEPTRRLPGNLNVSFIGVEADALMMDARELAVSSGSACTSASAAPSHVLKAIGLDNRTARSAIRFGVGRFNTDEEIERACEIIVTEVRTLREMSRGSVTAGRTEDNSRRTAI